MLAPVRESYRTGRSIEWSRLHQLAEFAYFDHSVHINKGVSCANCHGQVDQMPLMWQHGTLLMEWCLDCHRAPERYLRPREYVFDMKWTADLIGRAQLELGHELIDKYHVQKLRHCSTCHR